MQHTEKIEQAIQKASLLHHGQTRKGDIDYPYVTHLFSVAAIISQYVDDEDVIVAGLLHDTLEDTDYTYDELKEEFGGRVADIVAGVTIPENATGEKSPWRNSRDAYIDNLRNAPQESALVSAADKMHNFSSIMRDYRDNPSDFWDDFGGTYEDRVVAYGKIVDLIEEKLGLSHQAAIDVRKTYEDYKRFLVTTKD